MTARPTRRRFLSILAGGTGLALLPAVRAETPVVRWRGTALGAEASIAIATTEPKAARDAIAAARDELAWTEKLFSLYRSDSYLSVLNRNGRLDAPPAAFSGLFALSKRISEISDGAFDVTVQPLWRVLAGSVRRQEEIEAARDLVDWRRVSSDSGSIAFAHRGMAATLNGIAQGYATDRVADALRAHGFGNVLAHVGEFSGHGLRPDGTPWHIGIASPFDGSMVEVLPLSNAAVATSSPTGTRIGPDGDRSHILDPRKGQPANAWANVTVTAPSAALADGLSTAIAAAPRDSAARILAKGGGISAHLIDQAGRLEKIQT